MRAYLCFQIDYPAFEGSNEPPELGGKLAPPFARPLTMHMPHCFDPSAGEESLCMVGAPHGATQWEVLNTIRSAQDLDRCALESVAGCSSVQGLQ